MKQNLASLGRMDWGIHSFEAVVSSDLKRGIRKRR